MPAPVYRLSALLRDYGISPAEAHRHFNHIIFFFTQPACDRRAGSSVMIFGKRIHVQLHVVEL
jgi:hypothetical protein